MVDIPVPEEELMTLLALVDAIELDENAPEELQKILTEAIQTRNNYGPAQQTPDPAMAAPA